MHTTQQIDRNIKKLSSGGRLDKSFIHDVSELLSTLRKENRLEFTNDKIILKEPNNTNNEQSYYSNLIKQENKNHARLMKDKEFELAKLQSSPAAAAIELLKIQLEIKKQENDSLALQLELSRNNLLKKTKTSQKDKKNC